MALFFVGVGSPVWFQLIAATPALWLLAFGQRSRP